MILVTVRSERPRVPDEDYDVEAVPRIGDAIMTRHMALARVTEVIWHLPSGKVTITAR